MTVVGFDLGTRRIGIAVMETLTGVASPLETVEAGAGQWLRIDKILADWRPQRLVVGQPWQADGGPNAMTATCARFAAELTMRTGLPADLVDERLSSHLAAQRLDAQGKGRKRRSDPGLIDRVAAACILESWAGSGASTT